MFHCVQVPITDVYGPTAWDADLQCLVVTTDTARGAEKVNEERKRKVSECAREFLNHRSTSVQGLSQLAVHMVELVGSEVSARGVVVGGVQEADKLSSSAIRRSMLGEYRAPKVVCDTWKNMFIAF